MTTERAGIAAGHPVNGEAAAGAAATAAEIARLQGIARGIRRTILDTVHHAGAGHPGGSLSVADILVALYFHELRIDPTQPRWPDRDRLVFSKGHASAGLYSVLANRGFFPMDELLTFDKVNSRLQAHPDVTATPGVDASTGSLGQGLSIAVGYALGARVLGAGWRTWAILGDGESQEGQVWEAALVAARDGLANLTAIVDWNGLQQFGWQDGPDKSRRRSPLDKPADKWASFGWNVLEVDGNDVAQLLDRFARARAHDAGPTVIVARTVKGRGVSFMEGNYLWHAKAVGDDDYRRAIEELEA
jgi:transketolase